MKKIQKLIEQQRQEDIALYEEYGSFSFLHLCRQLKKIEQEEKEAQDRIKEQKQRIDELCDKYNLDHNEFHI